jgi:hypothetical protein
MFPPGRARLATRPLPTGSPALAKTIGIVVVACLAASGARVPAATITSTLRRTNSAASSGRRSSRFSACLSSRTMLLPSIQPNSRSASTKADRSSGVAKPALKRAILNTFSGCCARAASGHAIALPASAMNSRLFMRSALLGLPRRSRISAFDKGHRAHQRGMLRRNALASDGNCGSPLTKSAVSTDPWPSPGLPAAAD